MRLLIAILIGFTGLAKAETIDRIAVSAGSQVVTESAILLDLRVSAFLDRVPVNYSADAKRKSANRLVDLMLILREAADSNLLLPGQTDAEKLLAMLKMEFGTEERFQAELKRYGISERDVAAQLLWGLIGFTFTDLRFQVPEVSDEEASAYYEKSGLTTPFEANRDKIKTDMAEERATQALEDWLRMAREAARVTFREKVFQ